ncbi:MAG: hypothetical protein IBJ09_08725 [Bacteroidia bacterium]|nr:hypothetical protein [Bacteroidia bacterium]
MAKTTFFKNFRAFGALCIIVPAAAWGIRSIQQNNLPVEKIHDNSPYDSLWVKIDSLEKMGMYGDADKKTQELFSKAAAEKNELQLIRAMFYKGKFMNELEEDSRAKFMKLLREQTELAAFPTWNILYSIQARILQESMQADLYNLAQRKEVTEDSEDMDTWTLERFTKEIDSLYMRSVENSAGLLKIPVSRYTYILTGDKETEPLRPTLYDLLAFRALSYYAEPAGYYDVPVYSSGLNDSLFFAAPESFLALNIDKETNPKVRRTLGLVKDIMQLHRGKEKEAFADADYHRILILRRMATDEKADQWFRAALERQLKSYRENLVYTDLLLELAALDIKEGNAYRKEDPYDTRKNKLKEAVTRLKEIEKAYPGAYAGSRAAAMREEIESPELNSNMQQMQQTEAAVLLKLNYRNLDKVNIRIINVSSAFWDKWNADLRDTARSRELARMPASYETVQALPLSGEYRDQSAEIMLPGLGGGLYLMELSGRGKYDDSEQLSYTLFSVSDIGFYTRREGSKLMMKVFSNKDHKSLAGAKVRLYKQRWSNGRNTSTVDKEGTSGKDGWVLFETSDRYDSYSAVEIVHKKQSMYIPMHIYAGKGYEYSQPDEASIAFFTDRKIYRPGQTVFFKAIHYLSSGNAAANRALARKKIRISLRDANYEEVSQQTLETNEYGSIEGSFTLPSSGVTGNYTLETDHGSTGLSVEEYKRPTFETKIEAPEKSYKLGENVKLKVNAKALAGYGIGKAQVVYYVERTASFPRWCWWMPNIPAKRIVAGTGTTDAAGNFELEFSLDPDPTVNKKNDPTFSYRIVADITDEAGETRSATYYLQAAYRSLDLQLNVPASVDVNSDTLLYITASNLAGKAQATDVSVEIVKLEQPAGGKMARLWSKADTVLIPETVFRKHFPHFAWAEEDVPAKMKTEYSVYNGKINTGSFHGLAMNSLERKPAPGVYKVTLKATDSYGQAVKAEQTIEITANDPRELKYGPMFDIVEIKTQAEPGEKAEILLRSAAPNTLVNIRVMHKNRTQQFMELNLNREQQRLRFDVPESYRGNFSISVTAVSAGRFYTQTIPVYVPFSNKQFTMEFETIRKTFLPGSEQEWTLKLTPNKYTETDKSKPFNPEVLLAMYDASLDAFAPNAFSADFFRMDYYYDDASSPMNEMAREQAIRKYRHVQSYLAKPEYYNINTFGYSTYSYRMYSYGWGVAAGVPVMPMRSESRNRREADQEESEKAVLDEVSTGNYKVPAEGNMQQKKAEDQSGKDNDAQAEGPRSNFNETAFFFPALHPGADGKVNVRFKAPESLTRWKILGLAHTPDLQTASLAEEVIAKKELMISTFAPRFFNEGDELSFSAKVVNLTEGILGGKASLQLFDGITGEDISAKALLREEKGSFEIKAGESEQVSWRVKIPQQTSLIRYIVKASSGTHSDGEEGIRSVLSTRILLTEALAFGVRGKESKTFTLARLKDLKSPTLRSERLVLEFTSNPAWYAIQSLPYLMEYPYECAEQTFARYYANSIGAHLVNSRPEIRQVFEAWRTAQPAALQSALEKNQDLKNVLLEESPWVQEARSESERKQRLALLFDINRVENERRGALNKLGNMQLPSGGWPWFKNGREDRYITQHIVTGLGKMNLMGVESAPKADEMAENALRFLDAEVAADYVRLKKNLSPKQIDEWTISPLYVHFLYTRSFYPETAVPEANKEVMAFLLEKARKNWTQLGRPEQAMLALYLQRSVKDTKQAKDIMLSLKNRAIHSEELGMYWKGMLAGYYWYEQPVEEMALMIEAFDEVLNDAASVDEMKLWLLKNKQTNDWKSTKATTDAVYALMKKGTDWVITEGQSALSIGTEKIDMAAEKAEAGTGYFRKEWPAAQIKPDMGTVQVTQNAAVPAWGALYWQYTEEMDKVSAAGKNFTIQRNMFKQVQGTAGATGEQITDKTALKPGDRVLIRLVFTTDRPLEYVHIKDRRAAGLEPENVFSSYRYQDGLSYYESTRDAATHFFVSFIPRGTYVFSYYARVTHNGAFMGGMASAQCMYAPEFTAHSNGSRLTINGK